MMPKDLNPGYPWRNVTCSFLVIMLLSLSLSGADTRILRYPMPPNAADDRRLSATVNQTPVSFEFFRNYQTYYYETAYCRFAADGPVDVVLPLPVEYKKVFLRGLLQDLPINRENDRLRFTLPGPGHYYLQVPEKSYPQPDNEESGTFTIAFWIDDLETFNRNRMDPMAVGVIDITKAGVIADADKDQTQALQSIMNKGGRIYIPAGIYRTGTLKLASHSEIYLAPGALLKATAKQDRVDSRLLLMQNINDVHIHGPGTIDANFDACFQDKPSVHIVDVIDCHHVELEDVCFRNCSSWAVHLFGSDQIRCHNIRILSGKDGIDPDSASDVMIDGVFIQAKDDAIAVKTRKPPKAAERITVRNSIVASDASALKIGTETNALMRDILFENCDVFDSDRGLVLYARDGGPIENVTWRNIRLFMLHWPHETGGAPIQLFITKRNGLTPVRNLVIEHVQSNIIVPCGLAGLADAPLQGARIRDLYLRVDPPQGSFSYFRGNQDAFAPKLDLLVLPARPDLFISGDHVDVTIHGLYIDWQGNRGLWRHIVEENKGVKIQNLIQCN